MFINQFRNKTVYAFGDSIVYGHTSPDKSFMQLIADETSLSLTMKAVNGATVIAGSGNDIITQINTAPASEPDIVVFDGYTNDAYESVLNSLGSPKGHKATSFDNKTFCGAFEEIIFTIRHKWPHAKVLYITVHKNAARDWSIQRVLKDAATAMCEHWNVRVADVFNDAELDTRDADKMAAYIIGQSGSHPNEDGCNKFYVPIVKENLAALLSAK